MQDRALIPPHELSELAMKKTKRDVFIMLQCQGCKETTAYKTNLLGKVYLKEYKKNGAVNQSCFCEGSDGMGNAPHKIVGIYSEIVSRLGQESMIIRDLERKKWG